MFTRSLVYPVSGRIHSCSGGHGCPDVLEMESGDYAVIGTDITSQAIALLPSGSGCGPDERVVQVPRAVMTRAHQTIPSGS